MKRVLFVIPTLSSGGIEIYLLRFLCYAGSKMQPTILVRSNRDGELLEMFRATGYPIIMMPLTYYNPLRWVKFCHFLLTNDFHVVCDFNANFAGITLFLARLVKVGKRIVFYRQASDHFNRTILRRFYNWLMKRLVLASATKILSNSSSALEFFFGEGWKKNYRYEVIYNGVDAAPFLSQFSGLELRKDLGLPANAFVIGHTGRYDKAKNHETLLIVAQKLIKQDSKTFFVLSGKGTSELAGRCRMLGIEKNVKLLGYRTDVPKILSVMDLFFFPSFTEGQPNSLIEAMIKGVPVVVSRIPSIVEVLPPSLLQFALKPQDVEGYCEIISKIKCKQLGYDTQAVADYAIAKFDHVKRFDALTAILL